MTGLLCPTGGNIAGGPGSAPAVCGPFRDGGGGRGYDWWAIVVLYGWVQTAGLLGMGGRDRAVIADGQFNH